MLASALFVLVFQGLLTAAAALGAPAIPGLYVRAVEATGGVMILGIISAFLSGQYIGGGLFGFLGQVLGAVFGLIVFVFVYGLIGFVIAALQLAVAEGLQVFMDIEANTRS